MNNAYIHPQPKPINQESAATWDSVIADMIARNEQGYKKYRGYLTPGNGRNNLIDSYQEILDLAVYLKSEILENWQEPNEIW